MASLAELFEKQTGTKPISEVQLTVSGSNRKYYRLANKKISLIGVVGTSIEENRAFIAMALHFRKKGLPVPELGEVSDDELMYLQEDLGDTVLFDYLVNSRKTGVFSSEEKVFLHKTMEMLARFQVISRFVIHCRSSTNALYFGI
jgi:aminoglycoside/choline kinase family phosphotransferase